MTRITPAEVRGAREGWSNPHCVVAVDWLDRLAAQMEADHADLVSAIATADAKVTEAAALRSEVAALTPEAEEMRALRAVRDHAMRDQGWGLGWDVAGKWWCYEAENRSVEISAPSPMALLAKLDALRPALPKEEWRWEFPDGALSDRPERSAEDARWRCENGQGGRPVRRVVDPDGTVHLYPEGRES